MAEEPVGEEGATIDFGPVLPAGFVQLNFAAQVKALDEDGNLVLLHVRPPDLTVWEAMGMSTSAAQYYERLMAGMEE